MTITETEAVRAMLAHHRMLEEHLTERVTALARAVAADRPYGPATADLVAYLADEVLTHAAAEEHTIYPAAARLGELASTVDEMIAEHRTLSAAVTRLTNAETGGAVVEQAHEIAALFSAHVIKENEILLPALQADQDVHLPALLAEMHHRTEAAGQAAADGDRDEAGHEAGDRDAPHSDPQAQMLSLLLAGTSELAKAGHADRASQLAASAWAALRDTRPDLAVRVTAALHGLARQVASGTPGTGPADGVHKPAAGPDLDVRDLAPAQRHEAIFAAYEALAPDTGFVLVNDHDPKPLRYQFEAEHAGAFTWETLEAGPAVWRVRIGRRSS